MSAPQNLFEGLALYELTNKRGGTLTYSPWSTPTLVDLKILGVPFERRRRSFVQIRTELAKQVGNDAVTVPTLEVPNGRTTTTTTTPGPSAGPQYITDSWAIAEWLAAHHPQGERVFGGAAGTEAGVAGRRLAAFVREWAKTVFGPNWRPVAITDIVPQLDDESREYFVNKKFTPAQIEAWRAQSTPEKRHDAIRNTIAALAPIEGMLAATPPIAAAVAAGGGGASTGTGSKWLAGGAHPTHADATLFGFYAFTRVTPEMARAVWVDAEGELPHVTAWARAMLEFVGAEIAGDLKSF